MKVCSNSPGHMTMMAILPVYVENPSKISGTKRHLALQCNLRGCEPFHNDDSKLTLTNFMTRLNLILNAFLWRKIRKAIFVSTFASVWASKVGLLSSNHESFFPNNEPLIY